MERGVASLKRLATHDLTRNVRDCGTRHKDPDWGQCGVVSRPNVAETSLDARLGDAGCTQAVRPKYVLAEQRRMGEWGYLKVDVAGTKADTTVDLLRTRARGATCPQ